jgi:predicted ATP-grasp superfamily ATP-dependent carboligase
MQPLTSIVVSDVTSYKAVVLIRFIRQNYPSVRVIATDHRPTARRFHTRFAHEIRILSVGPEAGTAYAGALAAIVKETGARHLIPVNSREIRVLMENRELFGDSLAYVGDADLYRTLDDKASFAELLSGEGLPMPTDHETLKAPLPLVVKPERGSSSKGVIYIRTEKERAAAIARLGEEAQGHVIQEYIDGEGIGYSGFFVNGQPLKAYAHRRVAEYPVTGGSSVVRERYPYEDAEQLKSLIQRLLAIAPWSGFAMFELKRRGPGDFVFIECNPRIWGSVHQGLADGVNYLAPLLGPTADKTTARPLRTAISPLDLLAFLGYLKSGNFRVIRDVISGLLRIRLDINPLTDPGAYLALFMRGE